MDYIKYVNSDTIRDYLYEIGYCLDVEQKIFVVDNCLFLSLEEKMTLLEKIMKETEQNLKLSVHEGTNSSKVLAKEFITRLLDRYLGLARLLKKDECESFYQLEVKNKDFSDFYYEGQFATYGDVINYRDRYLKNVPDTCTFRLKKIYLTGFLESNLASDKCIRAIYNADFKIMDLNCSGFYDEIDDISTDSLICYLPMPFKKGDILCRRQHCYHKTADTPCLSYQNPCVFTEAYPKENNSDNLMDASDIIIYGWYIDSTTGKLKHDHFEHRYDFEYLKEDLLPKDCTLYSISAFLNNEKDFHEEEAILTALYHLECYREKEYQKTKDNPLLEYAFSDECIKEEIRSKYALNKRLSCAFNMIDDSVRIWLDDERIAPSGYYHCHSVNEAIRRIRFCEKAHVLIEEINLDHDLGDYAKDGGDAVNILDWLEKRQTFYPVKIHTANPVGRRNMERILEKHWPKDEQDF